MPLQSQITPRGNGLCLLSFDAGGSRGISQLKILAEMMHRLNFEAKNSSMDRPCSVFDMIGGVGSGGFIAILLAVFGLTADEALNEFIDLSVNVLDKSGLDSQTRTSALRSHVANLMTKYKVNQEARLLNPNDYSRGCKVVVPISYKNHIGATFNLRNFNVRQEKVTDLTIAEALLAAVATPPLFEPLSISKNSTTFDYVGSDWIMSNPMQEIIGEARRAFGAEARVACLLSLGCGHPGVFSFPEDLYSSEWNRTLERVTVDAERKAQSLESQLKLLGLHYRFSVTNGLERDTLETKLDPGVIMAHTNVYVDDVQVSRRIDICTESVGMREGVSSLEQMTRVGGATTSAPRLPPLTKTFVMRKEPWKFIKKILLDPRDINNVDKPRMLIVTGIGGCGKTQLMIKFMNVHEAEFSSQFFIDGSSEDRIRADIIRNVRALGTEHSQKGFDECLIFLSNQKNNIPRLLLYDNVDDPELDLSPLLPEGSSCTIAITSRNRIIGNIYPESNLSLDIMTIDEAVHLLSYGSVSLTEQGRKNVEDLAHSLGYLPIALQQACSYMQHTGCSVKAYIGRLSTNRAKLLGREIKQQLDMKAISTYTAFETSFSRLSLYTQKFLQLLAYFHWSGFPLDLITLAAEYQFSKYRWMRIDHGNEFYSGKKMLEEIFHRDGEWDVTNLDDMLLSLQNYSLVTVASGVDTSLSQMHPLVHEWLRSRAPKSEQDIYQSAAVILLALGTYGDGTATMMYLSSHVMHMHPLWDRLHINNIVAFADILHESGALQDAIKLREMVIRELRKALDIDDTSLSNSLSDLARTYYGCGRLNEAQELEEEVLKTCRRVLGERHPETLKASVNLAATYRDLGRLADAEELQVKSLMVSKEVLGERHPETINVSVNLAATYRSLGRLKKAATIQVEALEMAKEILGERHPDTLRYSLGLAGTYSDLGRPVDAEGLQSKVLETAKEVLGECHPDTLRASLSLASTYRSLGRPKEAAIIQLEATKLTTVTLGECHPDTFHASLSLASTYRSLGRLKEAEIIQFKAVKLIKETLGELHPDNLRASLSLASTYRSLGRLKEAEMIQLETIKSTTETLGECHPDTIRASFSLATTYRSLGRLKEAAMIQVEILKMTKKVLGELHPDTFRASLYLGITYHSLGRLQEAMTIQVEVLKITKEVLGERHLDTLHAAAWLAEVYRDLGYLNKAKSLQEELLKTYKEIVEDRHPSTIFASHDLAITYREQGRFQDALVIQTDVLKSRKEVLGDNHPNTILASSSLASVLHSMRRLNEAETLAVEVLKRRVELLGTRHHDTLTASNNLAAIYCDLGRLEEAEIMQSETVVSMRETLGERHFKTTKAMLVLAKIYQSQRRKEDVLDLLATAEHIISDYLGVDHPQYLDCQKIRSDIQKGNDYMDSEAVSQIHVNLNPEWPADGSQPPAKRRRLV